MIALGIAGCKPRSAALPEDVQGVAVVLSGGGGRGYAHVGVLSVLHEHGVPVDLVIGTSVGALVGAMYAADPNPEALREAAMRFGYEDVIDIVLSLEAFEKGLVEGKAIESFTRTHVAARNIGDMKIPFVAIAADLDSGELVELDRGSVAKAVHASIAIPGVFQPTQHEGRRLIDGGVVANLAVDVARARGARQVIAVDVTEGISKVPPEDVLEIIVRALDIMMADMTRRQATRADVVIRPDVADISVLDFSQKRRAYDAGRKAATAKIEEVIELIGR